MGHSEIPVRDDHKGAGASSAETTQHLVDLASPQSLKAARAINEKSAHKQTVQSETSSLTAARLQELARERPVPTTVDNWQAKHSALVAKASHTQAKLQFFGDSITEFIGNGNMDAFNRNFASLKPENFGIAGDTTTGLFKRVNDGELNGHPKAAVVLIGTNDVPTPKSAHDIAADIGRIVESIRKRDPETKVLVMGILPRCAPNDPEKPDAARKIAQVNAEISHLDNGKTVRFIDISDKFRDARGQARQDLLPDYLHPNHDGYQVWSDAIKPVIAKMVGS